MANLASFWGIIRARYETWQQIRLFAHWRDQLDQRRST